MEKSVAVKILNAALSIDKELGNLDMAIRGVEDIEEKKALGKKMVDVICLLDQNFITPILKIHPDLDPGKNTPSA